MTFQYAVTEISNLFYNMNTSAQFYNNQNPATRGGPETTYYFINILKTLLRLPYKTLQEPTAITYMTNNKEHVRDFFTLLIPDTKDSKEITQMKKYILRRCLYFIDECRKKNPRKMILVMKHLFPMELNQIFLGDIPLETTGKNILNNYITGYRNVKKSKKENIMTIHENYLPMRKISVKTHPLQEKAQNVLRTKFIPSPIKQKLQKHIVRTRILESEKQIMKNRNRRSLSI